jgi:hypothetical protein
MTEPGPIEGSSIVRLIGVYDADGSIRGELAYWIGARLGSRHCALCDITHGKVRERADWKECKSSLNVPFETFHRDDAPREILQLPGLQLPAVLAQTEVGYVPLLDPSELSQCNGSPESMVEAISRSAEVNGLNW